MCGTVGIKTRLLYENLTFVCYSMAYAYVTRHFSMSPLASSTNDSQDQKEARRLIAYVVPFIADKRSRVLHGTLTQAVTNVWSKLDSVSAT